MTKISSRVSVIVEHQTENLSVDGANPSDPNIKDVMNIDIKLASEYDVEDIINIVKQSFAQYCNAIGINTIKALRENDLDVLHDIQCKHVYVVYLEEIPVASIRIEIKNEKAKVSRFAILPEYSSLGIGSKVLSLVEEILLPSQVEVIELYSAIDNERLKNFYIYNGYQIVSIDNSKEYRRGLFQKFLKEVEYYKDNYE